MNYFFCECCKRYYLDVFREYHDKKHKYMWLSNQYSVKSI